MDRVALPIRSLRYERPWRKLDGNLNAISSRKSTGLRVKLRSYSIYPPVMTADSGGEIYNCLRMIFSLSSPIPKDTLLKIAL